MYMIYMTFFSLRYNYFESDTVAGHSIVPVEDF